jgi:hypothetical protein
MKEKDQFKRVKKALRDAAQEVSWDNFTRTKKEQKKEGKPEHWAVLEVLYCRLDWAREALEGSEDLEEHLDTVLMVQAVIEGLQDIKEINQL